jgi:hypothetical protein
MKIPATFSTATVSPCFAIRVKREALPLRFVEKEEKTSFCAENSCQPYSNPSLQSERAPLNAGSYPSAGETYRMIDCVLIPRIVMDIDGHRSESGDFGRKTTEKRIVLPTKRLLTFHS